MSYTDQAFIKAYQTDALSVPTPTPAPPSPAAKTRTHESHRRGPHTHFGAATKRPLSDAMAEGEQPVEPVEQPEETKIELAGVTVARFPIPAIATRLADECGEAYRRMMAYASRSGEVIGLLGATRGVGCTTTTLATALALSQVQGPVAVIDAAPEEDGLAASLGVLRTRSIARTLTAGGNVTEALVHSEQDGLSLGVAFQHGEDEDPRTSGALRSLTATHAAVLVDLGCDIESIAAQPSRGADALLLDAVVIVRQANHGEADVMFARRVLTASGHTVVGVIESFAA